MKDGWKKQKLKDSCEVFTDGDWIETKNQSPQGIRLVQTGNIGFGYFKNKKDKARYISDSTFNDLKCTEVLPGDLLISRLPDPVGKSCIVPDLDIKMITGVDCTIVRPKEFLDPEYLMYYQQSHLYLRDVQSRVTGTTRSRISRKNLGLIEIPIPPLAEQKQIVSILDKAFAAIDQAKANIEKNIQNAEELFQSKLNEVFSQKGEGWEEKKLDDVCNIKGRIGYRGYTKKDLVKQGEGAITLSPSNIINNRFDTSKCTYISWFKYEESPEIMVFEDDILFVKTGSTYGKTAIVDSLDEKATINPQFVVLKNVACLNKFLYYALLTREFKQKIENIVGGTATPTLSQTNLGLQTIFIPDEEKQREIVEILDSLIRNTDFLHYAYTSKLDKLKDLKSSILSKAFCGELTSSSKSLEQTQSTV